LKIDEWLFNALFMVKKGVFEWIRTGHQGRNLFPSLSDQTVSFSVWV